MDAARVKPGLQTTVNVKFSPVNDEKVAAEISFLTLNPDDPKTFHEFVFLCSAHPSVLYLSWSLKKSGG